MRPRKSGRGRWPRRTAMWTAEGLRYCRRSASWAVVSSSGLGPRLPAKFARASPGAWASGAIALGSGPSCRSGDALPSAGRSTSAGRCA